MRETKLRNSNYRITVDIKELAGMLGCGTATARQIGSKADAEFRIGRRVLYNVKKIEDYVDSLTV